MRKLLWCCMVMALLSVAGPQKVVAQNGGGFGAAMEWISRLSGPQFAGGSTSLFLPDFWRADPRSRRLRLRFIGGYHESISSDDVIDPDGQSIKMLTFQPMVEIPIWPRYPTTWHIEGGIGFAWHWFDGEPNAWNESIPAHLQFVRSLGDLFGYRLDVKVGASGRYWMKFADSDFLPLIVTMDRNKREFTRGLSLTFDWHRFHIW